MAAILPTFDIDNDGKLSRHFLPYQVRWILDESRMMLAEKSVRIGWTFADAFRNVRKRLQHKERDYLFTTKDQQSAIEYMDTCMKHAKIFGLTKSILSHGEDVMKVQGKDEDGKSVTEEVKFGYIKFDTGSRIIAFTSNPYAMAVFGGDVGGDEFAKHPQAEKLWETMQGRVTWGYDLALWSAHDGTDTLFNQFAKEAAAGKGGWSHYRVTMEDAVEMGLVDKINQTRGTHFTREEFIRDCKNRARLPEVYEQAYNCNPIGASSAIVAQSVIDACRRPITAFERFHFERAEIISLFGEYDDTKALARQTKIREFLRGVFDGAFTERTAHLLGFDVAASGEGDLCCIWVDRIAGDQHEAAALLTMRTEDWDFIQTSLWTFGEHLTAWSGAGDETGLGREICWRTAQKFKNRFRGVNFRGNKHDMGLALMNRLSTQNKILPAALPDGTDPHADMAADIFALRKIWRGGRWYFTESRNILNDASHCDMAWAAALADEARAFKTPVAKPMRIPGGKWAGRFAARKERSVA